MYFGWLSVINEVPPVHLDILSKHIRNPSLMLTQWFVTMATCTCQYGVSESYTSNYLVVMAGARV